MHNPRLLLFIFGLLHAWVEACYFPIELQGEYVVQVTGIAPGGRVQYSQVNITAEAIPIWGHCHRRIGNRFILTDSSGGANCSRCFHIMLRSRNVLQVRTEGLDKCYTNQDAAEATCPDERIIQPSDISKAIVFYKTREVGGEDMKQVYCPINGRFNFIYSMNDGTNTRMECPDPLSVLDNCPSGSDLNLRFRNCLFQNRDVTFQCLGHWAGPGDQHFLALRDTSIDTQHRLPPYRCALYREEAGTGTIYMAFSSDSTCSSNLHSATSGFEMFTLSVVPSIGWPTRVDNSNCRFPPWSHGYWQHMYIEGNTLTYKDHATFKTYTIRCLGPESASSERFPVFARTQCGEELYTCIWLKRRGVNVLEFQLGLESSTYYNSSLCADLNFVQRQWITQGRLERLEESPCPVAGEYAGVIPDATNLCAKLSSDCRSPEIMYYTVSDCSHNEIYEGIRRRGRTRRQTGTRIYRISNPRSSTTPPPVAPPLSSFDLDTPSDSLRDDRQLSDPSYERMNYSHYSALGARYPTTYHIGNASTTTYNPVTYSDEEYDPWTFSKTHGQQGNNHTQSHPYNIDHRPVGWSTDTYGRGATPKSNRDWNSSTRIYPVPTTDWHVTQRTDGHWQGTARPVEKYPEYNRNHGYPHNQYPHSTDRPYENRNWDTRQNEHLPSTQRPFENYPGTNRNQGYPQSTQRSSEKYPGESRNFPDNGFPQTSERSSGINREQGFSQSQYPHSFQTTERTYGANRNQGYPKNEYPHSTQRSFENNPEMNRNHAYPQSQHPQSAQRPYQNYPPTQRSFEDHSVTNRNQGFPQNEYIPPTPRSGMDRNQGFPQNNFPQSNQREYESRVPGFHQSTQRPFENYPGERNQGFPQSTQTSYENSPVTYRSKNVPHNQVAQSTQRSFENFPGGNRNQGFSQVTPRTAGNYPDEYRKPGSYNPQGYQRKPTVSTAGIEIMDRNHGTGIPNRRLDDRHPPWEVQVPKPIQLPLLPVQRPRPGDRPSAVPRTAAPSKREEREYRCLGQWKEDGLMYTYTQRRDVGTYECFVGSIVSENEIYIKEAGVHCERDIDPMHYGMKLTRKGSCFGSQPGPGNNPGLPPTGGLPQPRPTTPWHSTRHPPEPTKPWKPITAPPRDASGAGCYSSTSFLQLFLFAVFVVFCHPQAIYAA